MNLYIFNESSRAAVYGIGTYIHELIAALKDSDLNVCVVHLRSDRPNMELEESDGIRHWHIPLPMSQNTSLDWERQSTLYYRNVVYLLQLHIKDKENLTFHLNYNQSSQLAEALKSVFDCRIVTVVHYSNWGFSIYDNLPRLRSVLLDEHPDKFGEILKKSVEDEKIFFSKVDRVVCLSNYMHEILCSDYQLSDEKISVIPNGLTDMACTTNDRKLLRSRWRFTNREKIILFAGRMDKIKGLEYLLKAFGDILQICPQCRLIIAGNGDFNVYTKISQDICTRISYTGLLEKQQLYELYQLADIGVVPSLYEPFGYVAVEMMMHSLPIVATSTSGLNEVVDDTCGLKVPVVEYPDRVEIDHDLLAEKILYLLQHPAEACKMGQNGRKRCLREYSSEVFRKNMINFYTSLYDTKDHSSDMGRRTTA